MSTKRRISRPLAALSAAIALTAVTPASGPAQTVRVGAGEHGEHSRVVLNLSPPSGWRARNVEGGVEIVLPGVSDRFLDDAITERQRAHRVETFTVRREPSSTVVRMDFNCECNASVYEMDGRALVVDIKDGPPPGPIATEDPTAEPKESEGDPALGDIERAREMLIAQLKRAEEQGLISFQKGSELKGAEDAADHKEMAPSDGAPASEEHADAAHAAQAEAGHPDAELIGHLKSFYGEDAAPAEDAPAHIEHAPEPQTEATLEEDEHPDAALIAHVKSFYGVEPELKAVPSAQADPADDEHAKGEHATGDHGDMADADASHSEPDHGDMAHAEDAHAKPDHGDMAHTDEAPAEADHGDAAHADDMHGKSDHGDMVHAEDAHAKTDHGDIAHAEDAHAKPDHGDMAHAEDAHAKPDHGDMAHAEDAHAKPDHSDAPHTDDAHATPDDGHMAHADDGHGSDDHGAGASAPHSNPYAAAIVKAEGTRPEDAQVDPAPCLPDKMFDVSRWRERGPFFEVLASKRSAVFDELARVDPDGVVALARHYLMAGLGIEAASVPESFGVETPEALIVAAMARVLEKETPREGGLFAGPEPCPGAHGLWQAAALAQSEPMTAAKAFAVTGRALSRVPDPLRRTLGARIGLALVAAGDADGANELLKLLERSYDAPTIEMKMLEAEIADAQGRDVVARAVLRQVADSRGPENVVALVRLSEMLQAPSDQARMPSLAQELADAAAAWRQEPYGETIVAAEAKLRARFGDLVGAIDAIDRMQDRLDPPSERLAALRRALVEAEIAGVAQGGDADRIAAAIEVVRNGPANEATKRQKLDLAETLIDVGAAHLTSLLIDPVLQATDPRAADIALRASAAADLTGAPKKYPPRDEQTAAEDGVGAGDDYPRPDAPETAEAPKPIETADAPETADAEFEALRRRAFDAYLRAPLQRPAVIEELKASPHPEAPALISLLSVETDAPAVAPSEAPQTPKAVGGGKALIKDLDAELELIKEIATDG